jgi:hypothetical protein
MAHGAQSFLFTPEQVFWIMNRAEAASEIGRSIPDLRDALVLGAEAGTLTGDGGVNTSQRDPRSFLHVSPHRLVPNCENRGADSCRP